MTTLKPWSNQDKSFILPLSALKTGRSWLTIFVQSQKCARKDFFPSKSFKESKNVFSE
jgi:hypothetical protein